MNAVETEAVAAALTQTVLDEAAREAREAREGEDTAAREAAAAREAVEAREAAARKAEMEAKTVTAALAQTVLDEAAAREAAAREAEVAMDVETAAMALLDAILRESEMAEVRDNLREEYNSFKELTENLNYELDTTLDSRKGYDQYERAFGTFANLKQGINELLEDLESIINRLSDRATSIQEAKKMKQDVFERLNVFDESTYYANTLDQMKIAKQLGSQLQEELQEELRKARLSRRRRSRSRSPTKPASKQQKP